ncbi:MAG: hypothetical protein ACK4TA_04800 [Saprospiraceae bacterium]
MKHFFIVHSSITWLVSKQLMESEQLSPADCTILTDRRMPVPPGAYHIKDITDLSLHDLKWREANQLLQLQQQNRVRLREIDQIITSFCTNGENFQLYLPHHRDMRYWAFTTHPRCERFFYIEEGTMSYWGTNPIPVIPQHLGWHWMVKRFILNLLYDWYLLGRAPALPRNFHTNSRKYGGAYGLSKLSFPGLPNVKLLPLPFESSPEWAHVQHVLVFGPYVEFGELPQAVRLKVTQQLFNNFIKNGISTIYIKFHPTQLAHPKNLAQLKALIATFSDRIEFIELPQSVSLENIACSSKANFYLITSSVAIYALLCGSRVMSYAKQVLKYHPNFQKTLDTMPKKVWEKLEFIEF